MCKDYNKWHKRKTFLEKENKKILFNEREIWWCSLGKNIGDEEDGKNNLFERPVLIIRKFNNEIFFGLPITSKKKDNKYYYEYNSLQIKGSIMISQGKLLSKKRLLRKMSKMGRGLFFDIVEKFKNLF